MTKTLNVLFGTESGNSEKLANSIELTAKEIAKQVNFQVIKRNLKDVQLADLGSMENFVIVISTWGEGDPPGSCEKFCKDLYAAKTPDLSASRYAVLSMGDRSYQDFCGCGRRVDESISRLGGQAIIPRKDMDLDYASHFENWEVELFSKLAPSLQQA
jgi:sulfite reductase alpha subunit-like flavoprotein